MGEREKEHDDTAESTRCTTYCTLLFLVHFRYASRVTHQDVTSDQRSDRWPTHKTSLLAFVHHVQRAPLSSFSVLAVRNN